MPCQISAPTVFDISSTYYALTTLQLAKMVSQDPFKYIQLQPSMNTARVVDILPGDDSTPIQCQMRVINLDVASPYCALSYVWGERSECYKISVDQKEKWVTQKLYEAMQHLRSRAETFTIWIDAICINQLDSSEKSVQVRKMQEIYGRSKEVLIWLGSERDGSASAIALASFISAYWSEKGLNLTDAESDFRHKSIADLSILLDRCKIDSTSVEAFRLLIARDWFERVWTVQEAAAPVKKKTIQCGYSRIDWWSFIAAAKFLSHAIIRPDLKDYFPNSNPLSTTTPLRGLFNLDQLQRLIEGGSHQTDLLRTLANHRHYKATDPRDKVYALLGLVTEALTEDWVYNYSLDFRTVYLKVAEHCILHQGSFECLGYCNPSARDPDLSTWIPNWHDPSVRHPLAYHSKQKSGFGGPNLFLKRMYSSSADVTSQKRRIDLSIPQRPRLVTEGFCVGNVVVTRPPHYHDAIHVLTEREPDNPQDIYRPTGETILEAFSHTVVADVAKKGPLRERGYRIDWHCWRSVKNYVQPPTSTQRRVEWGSLLFATFGRSFVLSNNGYMCLAPGETRPGDQICVLLGGHVFYVLRPVGDHWSFIGECYVHGFMDGEAMGLLEKGTFELQEFTIA